MEEGNNITEPTESVEFHENVGLENAGPQENAGDFQVGESTEPVDTAHELSTNHRETESPQPYISIETHLESNINVIENQNNENLERDSERTDPNEIENTESVETKEPDKEELAYSKHDEGNADDLSADNSQEQESSENKYAADEGDSILDEFGKDKASESNVTDEKTQDQLENVSETSRTSLADANEDVANETEPVKEVHNINEETESRAPNIESGIVSSDNRILESSDSSDVAPNVEAESSEITDKDQAESMENKEDGNNRQEAETNLGEGLDKTNDTLPIEDEIVGENVKTNTKEPEGETNKPQEEISRPDEDLSTQEDLNKSAEGIVASGEEENCSSEQTDKETRELVENSNKTTEGKDKSTENTSKSAEEINMSVGETKGPSKKKNVEANEKTDTSKKTKGAGVSTSKNNEVVNNENIEFAQVNFDSNENEKENEDKEDSTNKDTETDPIASDVFDNSDEREGADEELCIIPDTEREFSQAEKDAASIIPPLRDISEASTSTLHDRDRDSSYEIRIYKYDKDDLQLCHECMLKRKVKYYFTEGGKYNYICDNNCLNVYKQNVSGKVLVTVEESGSLRVKNFIEAAGKEPPSLSFIRKCASCKKVTNEIENNLTWEIMDFCNEFCLSKYQREIGSRCSSCSGDVKSASLGKYCVRFGNDIRQFCTSTCLEQYKKGLKVCSYCQQDMSNGPEGFLAPVGEKGQFKDFCSKLCMEKYDIMTNDRPPKVASGTLCSVCKTEKPILIEFELDREPNYFCGEPCFVAFSFVNNISPGKCAMCRRHFSKSVLEKHTMYYDNVQHSFCSNSCENIYIIAHRKIVPCSWCKVKKYNFDMIKKYSKNGPVINMCSINCLSLYQVSLNAVNSKRVTCNYCQKSALPMYHLTMSDATIRNFCTYNCVMSFQNQFPKQPITLSNMGDSTFPVPTGTPKRNKKCPQTNESASPVSESSLLPVISSVQSLASANGTLAPSTPPGLAPISSSRLTRSKTSNVPQPPAAVAQLPTFAEMPVQIQVKQHFIVRPAPCPDQRNVATMCSVRKAVKNIQTKPTTADAAVQTEKEKITKVLIPVPVPLYVPAPCHMFAAPVPTPVPFPLPIPIPIFIPTTRNSAAGIMKEIKKIQVKIPTDPYEAELLMMAEMVAEEKKEENTDSESDLDDNAGDGGDYSPEPVDPSNTFGDDMLQMALKMATELDEPAVDLEGALTANTITAPQGGHPENPDENVDDPQPMHHIMERSSVRGRKRGMRGGPRGQSKRGRRMSHHQVDLPMMQQVQQAPPPPEPQEKPDANMCLKYTFGVNAWKQWVTTKNAELEKSSRRVKLFKTEILQLTSDELNYSLCLFVKEVRKPNGQEYAPDTIYYLCLGIQQYLFENGRIDNIFCDPYYEKFTDCLDEVAKKFSVLYNDSHYIVTRVEEEHLWESKQLGAHSPHVLLSTLMFFNTKHFNLTSVDEHMQLSFSHIMKHWKRNPNQPGASKVPGSRNVLLRFYPPQSAIQNNQRKKKVYEQQENEENPLRCPVKLYEFYLSKCPESVKTRNDVFYLQPERSCVPDSPVWYSTMPLPKEALEKMLHRVKMVKEINVALLTS